MHGRVEGGHEMENPLTLGILAGIFDMQQLPKAARVRWRAETPNYHIFEKTS